MWIIFLLLLIASIITILFTTIKIKISKTMNMIESFECGFKPLSNFRIPFSTYFFTITILFVILDLEFILLLPLIFSKLSIDLLLFNIITFFVLLTFGIILEWQNNIIEWSLPNHKKY